jgi:hypothetical protein
MDYFIQNGGKKKRTKTGSNSLKLKKSGGNFLGNLVDLKGKKAKDTIKKGGACTPMSKDEREKRGMDAMMSGNMALIDSIFLEEKFREICVEKQDLYRSFEREIEKLRMKHLQNKREEFPKEKIEELKRTWADTANRDMKIKLKEFIGKKTSTPFYVKFKTNILDNDRVLLCFTEQVTTSLTNQQFNSRTSTDMYVKFNNIFEDKRKLNSLLNKNNSGQKTESSLDMFSRLLSNASSQGHAAQFPKNSNNNNLYPAYHGIRTLK